MEPNTQQFKVGDTVRQFRKVKSDELVIGKHYYPHSVEDNPVLEYVGTDTYGDPNFKYISGPCNYSYNSKGFIGFIANSMNWYEILEPAQPTDRPAAVWSFESNDSISFKVTGKNFPLPFIVYGTYNEVEQLVSELNETAALRDELERAKAENERLRSGLSADELPEFVKWFGSFRDFHSIDEYTAKGFAELIAAWRQGK